MANPFFQLLRGTFSTIFMLGKAGPNLKNNSGVIEHRNNADTGFVIARGSDPVGVNDFLTLGYFNTNNAAAVDVALVKLPLATSTVVSTGTLPNNAIIVAARFDVTTAYDSGTTWTFRRTGDVSKVLQATADNDPTVIATYDVQQILDWGSTGAGTVTATVSGTPAAGVSTLYIFYATPTDIS